MTIKPDLVEAADLKAREMDRSRSWVIGEAVRQYVSSPLATVRPPNLRNAGLGPYRLIQLKADLLLTPEQRVLEAGRTANLSLNKSVYRDRLLTFDRYEDYLEWDRMDRVR